MSIKEIVISFGVCLFAGIGTMFILITAEPMSILIELFSQMPFVIQVFILLVMLFFIFLLWDSI